MKQHHYVYQITNNISAKKYIGVRSCDVHPLEDTDYMSSSKSLKAAIKEIGAEHFTKTVILMFDTRVDAIEAEIFLHNRFDVARNKMYYNKAIQTSTGFSHGHLGKKHSATTKAKISDACKGKNTGNKNPMYGKTGEKHYNYGNHLSVETRAKIGRANKGRAQSEEVRRRNSESHMGKRASTGTREKMSQSALGRTFSCETLKKLSDAHKNPKYSTHLMLYLQAQGRTKQGIADVIGCSLGTVYNRLKIASKTNKQN